MDLGAKAYVRWSIKQTGFCVNNEKKIFKNSILKYFSPLGKRSKQALEKHMGGRGLYSVGGRKESAVGKSVSQGKDRCEFASVCNSNM